jgi:hypothetical protein
MMMMTHPMVRSPNARLSPAGGDSLIVARHRAPITAAQRDNIRSR